MDRAIFEQLLHEEEHNALDFKEGQYRFAGATDDEKSELLKDILGFVNAWRRTDAYILIGVRDVRGGRSEVVGVAEHLDDHSLQQFVNGKTQRPIRLRYEAYCYDGKQVGILHIEQQPRPCYLEADYGRLKKQVVYVRRGSSTDLSKPATPDEVAEMGRKHDGASAAEISIGFADTQRDTEIGTETSWTAELCEMPDAETIPLLEPPRRIHPRLGIDQSLLSLGPRLNANYYRKLADYEFFHRLFRPVRLVVTNTGSVSTSNVRIEMEYPVGDGVVFVESSDAPELPKAQRDLRYSIEMPKVRPVRRYPGAVEIDRSEKRFRVEIDCNGLQPGRSVWTDMFYVGIGATRHLEIKGKLFADNLTKPKDFALSINANVSQRTFSVSELLHLRPPESNNEENDEDD